MVFKGAVELLRVISATFKNILKTKNIVIFFLNAEILLPGDILEGLKKSFQKVHHDSVKFVEQRCEMTKIQKVLVWFIPGC